jgi:hypothetical protein
MTELPAVEASHLTDAQRRAYIIADNKLALNAGWDDEMLRVEFAELTEAGFDLDLTGFSLDELFEISRLSDNNNDQQENPYNQKVESPTYDPVGEKPAIDDLYNDEKAMGLIEDIKNSSLTSHEKNFLMAAASRHIVFDYGMIANFYAHSSAECQALMENSALVIVDFEKAIEMGYVKLNEQIANLYLDENKGFDYE